MPSRGPTGMTLGCRTAFPPALAKEKRCTHGNCVSREEVHPTCPARLLRCPNLYNKCCKIGYGIGTRISCKVIDCNANCVAPSNNSHYDTNSP